MLSTTMLSTVVNYVCSKYKINVALPKMKPSSGILQETCFMQALTESLSLNPCS